MDAPGQHPPTPVSGEAAFEATAYYRAFVPPGPGPHPAVVALHGYGQAPEEMAAYARQVAPPGALVLAPEGPLSWYRRPEAQGGAAQGGVGYGWVADARREDADARNARLLDAVWRHASARWPLDPATSVVLGYSQGVGVGVAWLLAGGAPRGGLVALAGGVRVPLRARLPALNGLPTLWVTGARDRAYPAAYTRELLPVLAGAGLLLSHLELPCGHRVPDPATDAVRAWLAARLPL